MEGLLLGPLGERRTVARQASSISLALSEIDKRIVRLQSLAIENSTRKRYMTGARSYVKFCYQFHLPLDPTPTTLARYIAYTSRSIASGPKYLTGARHFLGDIYPDFDKIVPPLSSKLQSADQSNCALTRFDERNPYASTTLSCLTTSLPKASHTMICFLQLSYL